MKKIIFASGLLALMAAATSCEKYDLYPEQFDSVFSIREAGTYDVDLYSTDVVTAYPIVILKGGYDPETQSTATLKVMNDAEFETYAESLGAASYILIAPNCYSFSNDAEGNPELAKTYEFTSADKKAEIANLYMRPRAIMEWLNENRQKIDDEQLTPVIPITLVSETDTVSASNNITMLRIKVNIPELTVDAPAAPDKVTARLFNKPTFPEGEEYWDSPIINMQIPCANPWGFKVKIVTDHNKINRMIRDYEDNSGKRTLTLPQDHYILDSEVYFAPGEDSKRINLKVRLDDLDINKVYAVAVAFEDPGLVWDDPNNNPGDALAFDRTKYMIFTFRVNNNVELKKLALNDTMVTANDMDESDGGGIAALFDGNTETYFHSNWHVAAPREEKFASYLEITLPEPKSSFRFKLTNRKNAAATGYVKTVYLYGRNEGEDWPANPFARISNMNAAGLLDSSEATAEFGTDMEPFGDGSKEYKYIRFCVMESGGGDLRSPSTQIFWNASELELYTN